MNDYSMDIGAVRHAAKTAWKREQQIRQGLLDRVAASVPWWLIVIAVGVFGLSAAHTAGVFSQVSPVGYVAPFAVEFTLLFVAFSRVVTKSDHKRLSPVLRFAEILVFAMALCANGIGALDQIAKLSNMSDSSFSAILGKFGELPLTTQAALFFAPAFAIFVPTLTWISGEGLANLFMRSRTVDTDLETIWRTVEYDVLRRAFYQELLQHGSKPGEAKRQAAQMAGGFSDRAVTRSDTSVTGETKRDTARRLLTENPAYHALSLRELENETGIDRQTWHVVKNGNHTGLDHNEN